MQGFAHHPRRYLRRWGTVRLRMTLWNVAVLALILGALGGVVRYKVQADRFATVDRTLGRARLTRPDTCMRLALPMPGEKPAPGPE